jgi:RNA polymerase sigma-70 factor (ECF subfamily)
MGSRSFILPDERKLFSRIANGDEAAFSTVFYHYTARIHPSINKMTRSEEATEEIVHDVFVSIWNKRVTLTEIDNYEQWVFRIVTNLTYNYLKAKARRIAGMEKLPAVHDITYNTMDSLDFKESRELISEVVEQLPPQRKLIFKMSKEQGLNHEQIAEQLNISKNTVKNQMIEALKFIKEHLKKSPGASLTLIAIFLKIHG